MDSQFRSFYLSSYNPLHGFVIKKRDLDVLSYRGRLTHTCVRKLTIIGSDNGLSPGRLQAIIWPNAGILFIGTLETNFSEIPSEIHTFSFKNMHLKMSNARWRPFCLGFNVLSSWNYVWKTIWGYENIHDIFYIYIYIGVMAPCAHSSSWDLIMRMTWTH